MPYRLRRFTTAATKERTRRKWWTWPGSNRRPPACKAGALPAELHAPRFRHPVEQYTSCRSFSSNDKQPFSWNIWNNFPRQNKTVADSFGFREPSWEVFFKRRIEFTHVLRLVCEPELPQVFLAPLG